MRTKLCGIGLLLVVSIAIAGPLRTWTFEKSGKTVRAEVVGFSGASVTLKQSDGKTVSVPISYLVESNRAYLAEQRESLWKEVEVVKLEGAVSAGRYKKCAVQGSGLSGEILIQLLPEPVEAILIERNRQATLIADAQAWIEDRARTLNRAQAAADDFNTANMYNSYAPYRYVPETAKQQVREAAADLPKFRESYERYLEKTKAATVVKMKNTGFVYQGIPVWECADPRKRTQ